MDSELLLKAVSIVTAAGSGVRLLADASAPWQNRRAAINTVRQFCDETPSFGSFRFRILALAVISGVDFLALFLSVSAIGTALLMVGIALQLPFLNSDLTSLFTVPYMVTYGGIAFVLFIIGSVVLALEQSMSFAKLAWLFGKAEQTLADRLRRSEEGVFRIDEDRCERVAESIYEKLKKDPNYISGALLQPHNDSGRLANELVVGGLLEGVASQTHRSFGGDWQGYQPIQNHSLNGRPILAVESIRLTDPRDLAKAINEFFSGRGLPLSLTVEGLLEDLIRRLRTDHEGDASQLFSFSAPPWKDLIIGYTASIVCYGIGAVVLTLLGTTPWPFASGNCLSVLSKFGAAISALAIVIALLKNPMPWLDWLAVRLKLVTKFRVVQRRLSGLKRFGDREGMRRAQSKFAWEFGLFTADPRQVPVGSQKALLVSLKTGALVVSGTQRVSGADRDLWTFGELTIRKIGSHLRRLYVNGPIYNSIEGQFDPDNTVDGFLHRVGYKFCHSRACASSAAAEECPFRQARICDVVRPDTRREWNYERGPNVFSLQDRPKADGEVRSAKAPA